MRNIVLYFIELDFFYTEKYLGKSLRRRKREWVVIVYLLLSFGIFCRQITNFPEVDLKLDNLRFSVLIASFIIGFAILPAIIKRLNKRSKGKPKLEHTLSAFGFGFFVNLISEKLLVYFNI